MPTLARLLGTVLAFTGFAAALGSGLALLRGDAQPGLRVAGVLCFGGLGVAGLLLRARAMGAARRERIEARAREILVLAQRRSELADCDVVEALEMPLEEARDALSHLAREGAAVPDSDAEGRMIYRFGTRRISDR